MSQHPLARVCVRQVSTPRAHTRVCVCVQDLLRILEAHAGWGEVDDRAAAMRVG